MPVKSTVCSVAHFVPPRVVSNDDLAKYMDTSDEWITERTGIKERRFAGSDFTTSDLAFEASRVALERAGVKAGEIDLIIAATLSPDYYFPGIGTVLQHKLGMQDTPGLDIRVQCSGLIYGLATADAYIRAGLAKKVLLACAEVQSPALDLSNRGRDMAVLFGDGAGSLVVIGEECAEMPSPQNKQRGIIDSILGSDGSGAELLCLRAPGTATPGFLTEQDYTDGNWHPRMDGRAVFKNAVSRMCSACETILQRNKVSPEEIVMLFPHQANLRINEVVREKVGLPPERVFNNIQKYGNTTSATIPICLSEAEAAGAIKKGDLILTTAFGAGFTWGCNLLRW